MFSGFLTIKSHEQRDLEFTILTNDSGGALAQGDSVVIDTATTATGIGVVKPATATLSLFVGVVAAASASGAKVKVQRHGWCPNAKVTNTTNVTVDAGDILIPVNAQTYLARSGGSDGKSGFVFAVESVGTHTTPSAQLKKVFIRAL